ncbi:unnamed protein product, partial [Cyprideis torosa]
MDDLLQETRLIVRSILLTQKSRLSIPELCKEYREMTCDELPFKKLGCENPHELLKKLGSSVVRINRVAGPGGGTLMCYGVADSNTVHRQEMVSKQVSSRYSDASLRQQRYRQPLMYRPPRFSVPAGGERYYRTQTNYIRKPGLLPTPTRFTSLEENSFRSRSAAPRIGRSEINRIRKHMEGSSEKSKTMGVVVKGTAQPQLRDLMEPLPGSPDDSEDDSRALEEAVKRIKNARKDDSVVGLPKPSWMVLKPTSLSHRLRIYHLLLKNEPVGVAVEDFFSYYAVTYGMNFSPSDLSCENIMGVIEELDGEILVQERRDDKLFLRAISEAKDRAVLMAEEASLDEFPSKSQGDKKEGGNRSIEWKDVSDSVPGVSNVTPEFRKKVVNLLQQLKSAGMITEERPLSVEVFASHYESTYKQPICEPTSNPLQEIASLAPSCIRLLQDPNASRQGYFVAPSPSRLPSSPQPLPSTTSAPQPLMSMVVSPKPLPSTTSAPDSLPSTTLPPAPHEYRCVSQAPDEFLCCPSEVGSTETEARGCERLCPET